MNRGTDEEEELLKNIQDVGIRMKGLNLMCVNSNIDCEFLPTYIKDGAPNFDLSLKIIRHKGSADRLPSLSKLKFYWDFLSRV